MDNYGGTPTPGHSLPTAVAPGAIRPQTEPGTRRPQVGEGNVGPLPAAEPETVTLLLGVPELAARYLVLVEAADGDPGAAAAFEALADHVADLLYRSEHCQTQLVRCMAAVESVAASSPDADDLVTWGFLDNLSPGERSRLQPWIGPRTAVLAGTLDPPG